MIPGMNPRKMNAMMKKMGIQQVELDATEVVIKTADKEFVFANPQVSKVNMMGQETFQIVGTPQERAVSAEPDISDDDVETVVGQTGAPKEEALAAIKKFDGDLAQAILELKK